MSNFSKFPFQHEGRLVGTLSPIIRVKGNDRRSGEHDEKRKGNKSTVLKYSSPYRNSVYVALVTREGLLARSRANVPEFCTRVTRAGYECVRVWCQREGHYVARVSNEGGTLLTTFYVPQGANREKKYAIATRFIHFYERCIITNRRRSICGEPGERMGVYEVYFYYTFALILVTAQRYRIKLFSSFRCVSKSDRCIDNRNQKRLLARWRIIRTINDSYQVMSPELVTIWLSS